MSKHTPTPWTLKYPHLEIIGNDNNKVLEHFPYEGLSLNSDEDAAFIIKAVNMHEEILKVLRKVKDDCEAELASNGVICIDLEPIRRVISKAEDLENEL